MIVLNKYATAYIVLIFKFKQTNEQVLAQRGQGTLSMLFSTGQVPSKIGVGPWWLNQYLTTQQTQNILYNIYATSTQRLRRWSNFV